MYHLYVYKSSFPSWPFILNWPYQPNLSHRLSQPAAHVVSQPHHSTQHLKPIPVEDMTLSLFPDVPQCVEQNPTALLNDFKIRRGHLVPPLRNPQGVRGSLPIQVFTWSQIATKKRQSLESSNGGLHFQGPEDKADIWDHVAKHAPQASQQWGFSCKALAKRRNCN